MCVWTVDHTFIVDQLSKICFERKLGIECLNKFIKEKNKASTSSKKEKEMGTRLSAPILSEKKKGTMSLILNETTQVSNLVELGLCKPKL